MSCSAKIPSSPQDLAQAYGIISPGARLVASNVNWTLLLNNALVAAETGQSQNAAYSILGQLFTQAGTGGLWARLGGIADIRQFASLAGLLAQGLQGYRVSPEACQRIKDGIDLAKKIKVGAAAVVAVAGLITLFAPNPITGSVTLTAAVAGAVAQVSELILEKAFKDLDCENVLNGN